VATIHARPPSRGHPSCHHLNDDEIIAFNNFKLRASSISSPHHYHITTTVLLVAWSLLHIARRNFTLLARHVVPTTARISSSLAKSAPVHHSRSKHCERT
jgi:hypothetical protein